MVRPSNLFTYSVCIEPRSHPHSLLASVATPPHCDEFPNLLLLRSRWFWLKLPAAFDINSLHFLQLNKQKFIHPRRYFSSIPVDLPVHVKPIFLSDSSLDVSLL